MWKWPETPCRALPASLFSDSLSIMLCFCRRSFFFMSRSWSKIRPVSLEYSSPWGKSPDEAEWLAFTFNFILTRGKFWLAWLRSVSPSWSNLWAMTQRSGSPQLAPQVLEWRLEKGAHYGLGLEFSTGGNFFPQEKFGMSEDIFGCYKRVVTTVITVV